MPRDIASFVSPVLYLAGTGLILTGAFMLGGWPVVMMVAGAVAVLVGSLIA